MGFYKGPNIIKDGLVFGYDADDRSSRFYKGEPTINLYNTPSTPGLYFNESYNGNYGFGISTNSQWVIDNSDQPILGEDVQKISRINSGVSQTLYIAFTGMVLSAGIIFSPNEIKSISFYYYGTFGTQISPYIGGSSGFTLSSVDAINGNGTTSLTIPVPVNKWKRVQFQITNTLPSSSNFNWGWMVLHNNQPTATLDNTEYWKFTGIQIESKNHMTQNVGLGKSRLLTSSLIDLTKTHTIDLTKTKFDSTAHPYFNGGVGEKIITNFTSQLNDFTACVWYKCMGKSGYDRLLDKQHSDGFSIMRESGNNNRWGGSMLNASPPYGIYLTLPDGYWHYIVTVRSGSTHYLYGDGVDNKVSESCSTTPLSANSLAVGCWSASDSTQSFVGYAPVVQIYNRALSESEILQNYNALKSRFNL